MEDKEKRIQKLERQISEMEKELDQLTSIKSEFQNTKVFPTDKIWNCEKCGSRLGIYDIKSDELRIRHRDLFVYFVAGKGGSVKVVCRGCSHINKLKYEEK